MVPCTTPHSGDDGLGEPPQSMECRNGITWTPPLTYVVDLRLLLARGTSAIARLTLTDCVILFSLLDPWLLLAGDISVLARLILLFYFRSSTVAVTGRKYPRPRPVDCTILFSFTQPWLSLVGSIPALARLISLFYFLSINLWQAHSSPD